MNTSISSLFPQNEQPSRVFLATVPTVLRKHIILGKRRFLFWGRQVIVGVQRLLNPGQSILNGLLCNFCLGSVVLCDIRFFLLSKK